MVSTEFTKNAMIAAATEALNYRARNRCSDDEALAHVVTKINSILSKVE